MKFTQLTSRVAMLVSDDIDTDQIIPARFLKVTDKLGLGEKLFSDWRYESDGSPKADFVLNRPESVGRQVLLVGQNFGCGSSREHAPWALVDWGLRAIIATSFADIFNNNALKNGLLPVAVNAEVHGRLRAQLEADPTAEVEIDLASQTLRLPDGSECEFEVDPFSRKCLLEGTDQLGYLQSFSDQVVAYEQRTGKTAS